MKVGGGREMFLKIVYIVVYMKNMAYELLVPDPQDQMMVFRRLHLVPLLPLFFVSGGLERGEEVLVVPLVRRMRM